MITINVGTVTFNNVSFTVNESVRFTTSGNFIVELNLKGKGSHKDISATYDVADIDAANHTLLDTCAALAAVADAAEDTLTRKLKGCKYKGNGQSAVLAALSYLAQLDAPSDTKGWQQWDDLMLLN